MVLTNSTLIDSAGTGSFLLQCANALSGTHEATLNVTSLDVGGVSAETFAHFKLNVTSGVRVQILEPQAGLSETVHLDSQFPGREGAPDISLQLEHPT